MVKKKTKKNKLKYLFGCKTQKKWKLGFTLQLKGKAGQQQKIPTKLAHLSI